jgi:hypothetical protein
MPPRKKKRLLKEPTPVVEEITKEPEDTLPDDEDQEDIVINDDLSIPDEQEAPEEPPAPEEEPPAPEEQPPASQEQEAAEDSDGSSRTTGSTVVSKTKTVRKRKPKLSLTRECEEQLAAWYSEHREFWDKVNKDYSNKPKKDRLVAELIEEMGLQCEVNDVLTWFKSMRTAFSKLVKGGPSGAAKQNPTEKDKWILKNFACCEPHIRRLPGRSKPINEVSNIKTFFYKVLCIMSSVI